MSAPSPNPMTPAPCLDAANIAALGLGVDPTRKGTERLAAALSGVCPFCDSDPCQHLDECGSFAAMRHYQHVGSESERIAAEQDAQVARTAQSTALRMSQAIASGQMRREL